MASKIWITEGKVILTDNKVTVCDDCPCGEEGPCCPTLPETITVSITSTDGDSPCDGDFACGTMDGDYELVNLNLANPGMGYDPCQYLLHIDGQGDCSLSGGFSGWDITLFLYSQATLDSSVGCLKVFLIGLSGDGGGGSSATVGNWASDEVGECGPEIGQPLLDNLCSGGTFESNIGYLTGEGEYIIVNQCILSVTVTV